jgi:hypothetical protein
LGCGAGLHVLFNRGPPALGRVLREYYRMTNRESSDIVFSWTSVLKWLAVLLGAGVLAIGLGAAGGPTWLVIVLGFGALVVLVMPLFAGFGGNSICPLCESRLNLDSALANSLFSCPECNGYLEGKRKELFSVEPERVLEKPTFGVKLPWNDLDLVVSATVDPSAVPIVSKKGPQRELPAVWPDECCVCGGEVTRRETYTRNITKAARGAQLRDEEVLLAANDVPYCDDHKDGVAFRTILVYGQSARRLQLLFRSHAYRNKFRALNSWADKGAAS